VTAFDELLALVERLAALVPHLPRLAVLDAVEAEWLRLGASAQSTLAPFVGPAALWRLRAGAEPC
jgi:hypothetical protein